MSSGLSRAGNPIERSDGEVFSHLARNRARGPWRVFGGPVDAGSAPGERAGVEVDHDFLMRTEHVRLVLEEGAPKAGFMNGIRQMLKPQRRESAMEFIARTGLSPVQARTMTKAQITVFVEQAMRNRADDPGAVEPRGTFKPEPPKAGPLFVDTGASEPDNEPVDELRFT